MRAAILLGVALVWFVADSALAAESAPGTADEASVAATAGSASVGVAATPVAVERTGREAAADRFEAVRPPNRSARQWYEMGGAAMHGLALCSVLIFALILERWFTLRRAAFVPRSLEKAIDAAIEVGQRQEIKSLCERDASELARLARIALEGPGARERLAAEGAQAAHLAQRNLPLLSALGNLATMMGLLGTVLGMVEAFEVIARSGAGAGDARIVAGGIFRALVTTAAGLGIGIVAVAAHALFSRRATDFIVALETLVTRVAEEFDRPNPAFGERETLEST